MRYLGLCLALAMVACGDCGDTFQPTLLAQSVSLSSIGLSQYDIPEDMAPGAEGGEQLAEWVRNTMAAGVDPYQVLHEQFWHMSDHWLLTVSGAIDEIAQPSETEDGPFKSPWWYAVFNTDTRQYEMDSASVAAVKWWKPRDQ